MKAIILAAGRGNRLRPLTDKTPKPLISVGGRALIEHHIDHLAAAGIQEVVINVCYLGEQIIEKLGDGSDYGVHIHYSVEPEPLEVAGGIIHALPLLGENPFIIVNSDIWTNYPFTQLISYAKHFKNLAHIVLANNQPHHPEGDYGLDENKLLITTKQPKFTYSGMGLFSPQFFKHAGHGRVFLPPLIEAAIKDGTISAEHYAGQWYDVGNIPALQQLNEQLSHATTL